MRSLPALFGLLLASVLALCGCGGESAPKDTAPGTSTTPGQATEQSAAASDRNFADCSAIPAGAMGAVLGEGTATAEVPPAGRSCTYALEDHPELPSVNIEQFTVADFADGWDGAKAKIANTVVGDINGTPTSVPGIGDDAEIVSGPGSGTTPDAIGLVKLGDTIVRASVLDSSGLSPAEVATVTTNILRVVADHA